MPHSELNDNDAEKVHESSNFMTGKEEKVLNYLVLEKINTRSGLIYIYF